MHTDLVFKVNSPDIVSDTIDGEVVIVDLKSGDYYSLLNTATDIWDKIQQGLSIGQMLAYLESNYESASVDINDSTYSFLEQLQGKELIVIDSESPMQKEASQSSDLHQNTEKKTFEPPVFERFTDMEDLLLLDPIHEVNEQQGWPKAKSN